MKIPVLIISTMLMVTSGAPALAQEAEERNIVINYTVNVSDTKRPQFEAGIQKWSECFREHGDDPDDRWHAWTALTGDMLTYNFRSSPRQWASLDEHSPADETCGEIFLNDVAPHAHGVRGSIQRMVPELSRWQMEEPQAVQVFYFVLKDAYAFRQALGRITAAATEQEWGSQFGTIEIQAGGRGAPHMMVVVPHANFASLDTPQTPLWEMVTAAFGESEATRVREQLRDSIGESWSGIHRRAAHLDFGPAEE